MPSCLVVGGGLAGLSCAAALAQAGFDVTVFETKPFPGGRATSYELPGKTGAPVSIDNCQHILLRCCVNLLDFYTRLGAASQIEFFREFHFVEPGGRVSVLHAGKLPAPFHFSGAFLRLGFLDSREKLAVGRALLALRRQWFRRDDLDRITMLDWLGEQHQPPRAIERFWRPVLVSAVNEELGRMAARHGFQVMYLGFLAGRDTYEMGLPSVPLAQLYNAERWLRFERVKIRFRTPVQRLSIAGDQVAEAVLAGATAAADYYVSAVPFERLPALVPELKFDASTWEHSPITGIHLWFDRPVTNLPHAALLDRTIQWMFNKSGGRHLQLVVSASRDLVAMEAGAIVALVLRELGEFFPAVSGAKLVRSHVVKEVRATFSARPGLEPARPPAATAVVNLFLAGDWTRTGWPATMEGAVRSGYAAAEAVTAAAGAPQCFLLPDIA